MPVGVNVTVPPGWDGLDCCSHGLGRLSTALLPGLAVPEARRCSHGLGGAGRPDIVVWCALGVSRSSHSRGDILCLYVGRFLLEYLA